MERITVVKIGGNVIDSPEATARFVEAFAALEGPKLLVHGGGKLATRLAAQLGIESRMVDGRRITDRETLDVVTMVYAGLINKRLVAALSAAGCRAIGLSGADGNAVTARRRSPQPVDYGFVGDIERVDSALLRRLLEDGMAPVFSAIMHDGKGTLLNCNADSVASAVALGAAEIAPTDLVFCFEKAGVLRDPDDLPKVIAALAKHGYTHQGDLGLPGREAFFRPRDYNEEEQSVMKYHLYVCHPDAKPYLEHIAFRDYLRAHPQAIRLLPTPAAELRDIDTRSDLEALRGGKG